MWEYLKQRLKSYIAVIVGAIMGFIISASIFDNPDYTTAIITLLFGLTAGELFVFIKWRKETNKN